MKSKGLVKIVRRYLLSAAGIAVLLLALNGVIILAFSAWQLPKAQESSRFDIEKIASGLTETADGFVLDDEAQALFADRYQWGLLLDERGSGVWNLNLPEEIPLQYTAADIAQFSRWYLMDYPVTVWEYGEGGLLVLGSQKDSLVKYAEQIDRETLDSFLWLIPLAVLLHIAVAIGLAVLLGRRMYGSIRPVALAISDLADQKTISLPTSGLLGELSKNLNGTSQELQRQRALLEKRDQTRTEWIAGVSHDIRTPLTMVMGYAGQLEDDDTLSDEHRKQAVIIRVQSQRMKELISNLNLASRLEYGWQTLEKKPVCLAALIRTVVADYFNGGWDTRYTLIVEIMDNASDLRIEGDISLLRRIVQNLVDNSVRHNDEGCQIEISLCREGEDAVLTIEDDGCGISDQILLQMKNEAALDHTVKEHGMGITIVSQIVKVHGGQVVFEQGSHNGLRVKAIFPLACK